MSGSRRWARFRRHEHSGNHWHSWLTLLFMLVLLVALFMVRDRMATGAAGCFADMTEDPAPAPDPTPPEGGIRPLIVPSTRSPGQD